MKQLINALLLVLTIQSAMVATLYWPEAGLMEVLSTSELVPFEPYLLDEIHLGDDKGNEAVLVKLGEHWILPDLNGLEVNPELIDGLLKSVIGSESGWPVASSIAARQRFALTDYNFKRRLTLIGGGELLGTIYLGDSPAYRKVYARNSVHDGIFSISYSIIDAPANDNDWLDKRTLQVQSPTSISSENYSLRKNEDKWLSSQGGQPDKRELDALLLALGTVQINGVANDDLQRTLSIAVPDIKLSVETKEGTTQFEFFTLGERHFIHCSDRSMFFTMSNYDFNRFATLDARRLMGSE